MTKARNQEFHRIPPTTVYHNVGKSNARSSLQLTWCLDSMHTGCSCICSQIGRKARSESEMLGRNDIEEVSAFKACVTLACVKSRVGIERRGSPELEFDCLTVTTAGIAKLWEGFCGRQ